MFSHITENWRGRPLISREVIVNLIGHTTTGTGLTIQAELDENTYSSGIKMTMKTCGKSISYLPSFMAKTGTMPSNRDDKKYRLFIYVD